MKLAIVIPAYKKEFLKETLASLDRQTCKDFVLYIGDDSSPENLYEIVKPFENSLKIVYKRFSSNLGGSDLVSQWHRCIALTQHEEWIWLFSDDDLMDENCVENFYKCIGQDPQASVVHFDITIIDQFGKTIKDCAPFPEIMKPNEFFAKRVKFKINSSVVEFIFKKDTYLENGGFQNYDLAWCSDDATWIKFAGSAGILTIPDSKVQWRYSGSNISSNLHNKEIVMRKLRSSVSHIKWVSDFLKKRNWQDETTNFEKFKWVVSATLLSPSLSVSEKKKVFSDTINELEYHDIRLTASMYFTVASIKRYLVNKLK